MILPKGVETGSQGLHDWQLRSLAPPPRAVPLALALRVLFAGVVQQMGWLFFGFGMVFVWLFAGNAEIAWLQRAGPVAIASGQVAACIDTSASENNRRIFEVSYVYEVAGNEYRGASYATGRCMDAGRAVDVQYSAAEPSRSRIVGLRSAMFGPVVLFVVIFPAIGLLMILGGLPGRLRSLRLLREGVVAYGKLVGKSATNVRINNRPVMALRFEYRAQDGRTGQATARSHITDMLEDDAEEALLYDPQDLARALMFDAIPGSPGIGRNGEWQAGWGAALASMVMPALALGGHGAWAYLRYFA